MSRFVNRPSAKSQTRRVELLCPDLCTTTNRPESTSRCSYFSRSLRSSLPRRVAEQIVARYLLNLPYYCQCFDMSRPGLYNPPGSPPNYEKRTHNPAASEANKRESPPRRSGGRRPKPAGRNGSVAGFPATGPFRPEGFARRPPLRRSGDSLLLASLAAGLCVCFS